MPADSSAMPRDDRPVSPPSVCAPVALAHSPDVLVAEAVVERRQSRRAESAPRQRWSGQRWSGNYSAACLDPEERVQSGWEAQISCRDILSIRWDVVQAAQVGVGSHGAQRWDPAKLSNFRLLTAAAAELQRNQFVEFKQSIHRSDAPSPIPHRDRLARFISSAFADDRSRRMVAAGDEREMNIFGTALEAVLSDPAARCTTVLNEELALRVALAIDLTDMWSSRVPWELAEEALSCLCSLPQTTPLAAIQLTVERAAVKSLTTEISRRQRVMLSATKIHLEENGAILVRNATDSPVVLKTYKHGGRLQCTPSYTVHVPAGVLAVLPCSDGQTDMYSNGTWVGLCATASICIWDGADLVHLSSLDSVQRFIVGRFDARIASDAIRALIRAHDLEQARKHVCDGMPLRDVQLGSDLQQFCNDLVASVMCEAEARITAAMDRTNEATFESLDTDTLPEKEWNLPVRVFNHSATPIVLTTFDGADRYRRHSRMELIVAPGTSAECSANTDADGSIQLCVAELAEPPHLRRDSVTSAPGLDEAENTRAEVEDVAGTCAEQQTVSPGAADRAFATEAEHFVDRRAAADPTLPRPQPIDSAACPDMHAATTVDSGTAASQGVLVAAVESSTFGKLTRSMLATAVGVTSCTMSTLLGAAEAVPAVGWSVISKWNAQRSAAHGAALHFRCALGVGYVWTGHALFCADSEGACAEPARSIS